MSFKAVPRQIIGGLIAVQPRGLSPYLLYPVCVGLGFGSPFSLAKSLAGVVATQLLRR